MANTYSPASLDLGLGDGQLLSQQLGETEEERRKKKLQANPDAGQGGANAMGPAAMALLGGFNA